MLDQNRHPRRFPHGNRCQGDLISTITSTVEDTGLALGEALKIALGDKRGHLLLWFCAADGRMPCPLRTGYPPPCTWNIKPSLPTSVWAMFSTETIEHFFRLLSYTMGVTLHLKTKGKNDYHRVESLFKAFGRTLRQAIRVEGDTLPSSKGVL